MSMTDRMISLEEREISDAIANLQKSEGAAGCTGHRAVVVGQILSLRINELVLFRIEELQRTMLAAATTATAAATAATTAATNAASATPPWMLLVSKLSWPSSVVLLAICGTFWKIKGWI